MPTAGKPILILGRGAMGSMFASLLEDRHALQTWDRDPETGEETGPLEALAADSGVVILAVPAQPHDELVGRLAGVLPADALCLSIAKGLDREGDSPATVMARHFGENGPGWGVVYGPMIARDLSAGRDGFALAAGVDMASSRAIAELFEETPLYLDTGTDVQGAAWAAILKNVYVPLIGMADGLALGDNLRGFLLSEALAELAGILSARGADPATAYGLAGLGDLVTTATSASSHHRQLGEKLAGGDTSGIVAEGGHIRSEGVHAARMAIEHGLVDPAGAPLFALVAAVLEAPDTLRDRLGAYLARRFGRSMP